MLGAPSEVLQAGGVGLKREAGDSTALHLSVTHPLPCFVPPCHHGVHICFVFPHLLPHCGLQEDGDQCVSFDITSLVLGTFYATCAHVRLARTFWSISSEALGFYRA